jgi:glycosyltransferase involved in cell wall biosynthesis
MADRLGNEFDFHVVTSDRDRFDEAPYAGVGIDSWNTVGKAQVYYLSQQNRSLRAIARLLSDTPHDLLYLNSFFDPVFTQLPLWARRFGLLPKRPVVIAPRGEFAPASLATKRWKKVPYRLFASAVGLYRNLTWQASSAREADDILRNMGATAKRIVVAANMPPASGDQIVEYEEMPRRSGTAVRVVFLSRISPVKNLDLALRILARVRMPVEFTIHGPIYDNRYWERCRLLMTQVPSNVSIRYAGPVAHPDVPGTLRSHDLLFLPTRGENYGHVILESLSVGTPVLIADTTPWRDLEKAGVGWDLPLDDEQQFADKIEQAAQMLREARLPLRAHVSDYVRARAMDPEVLDSNRRLFTEVARMEEFAD